MSEGLGRAGLLNLAVWKRALRESLGLLAGCALAMFAFHWLYVYLSSLLTQSAFVSLFAELPDSMRGMLGIPIVEAAAPRGRVALGYVDPMVVVISAVWALARGSDAVSGPLDRGTLELVLAQPVSRLAVLAANAGVTMLGAAVIAAAAWLGTSAGVATVTIQQKLLLISVWVPLKNLVSCRDFVPSAVNLFALTAFAAGMTTFISACDRYRWRTLGIAGSVYLIQVVIKMIGLSAVRWQWLFHCTFLGAYWPQALALERQHVWALSLRYDGLLLGGAAICYLSAAIVFGRRDLPAPL